MEIIPSIDIINGSCVRLSQGNYELQTLYSHHPLDIAKKFETCGVKRLHLVDLDGARKGKIENLHVLEMIAKNTSLHIDYGGGVRTYEDIKNILNAGAKYISIGSLAAKQPEMMKEFLRIWGGDTFIFGADVKNFKLRINGWIEETQLDVFDFIEFYYNLGVNRFFCTDISRDGMLQGPAIDLYKNIIKQFPDIYLIASGGVSSIKDLYELKNCGCKAVIIGKAIYEGKISLEEVKEWNLKNRTLC